MTILSRRSLLTAAAASGAAAFGAPGLSLAQEGPLKIGFLMPLTGGAGKLGLMMLEGAQLAAEEINASSGVAGRKIELILEDSQALARNGVDGFRKLTNIDGTPVIITGWTSVSVAVAPLAAQSKVYLLSGSTASPAVRNLSPYFQSTWMYDDESVKLILPYARNELKIGKLGIVTVISDLGAGLSAAIKKDWERLGGAPPVEESHQAQETNFRPTVLKLMASSPEAIYITSSVGKQSAQIVRQARELGYTGYFLSFGAFEDPEVLAIGQKAEKCFYTTPGFDAASVEPAMKSFVDAFKAKFGRVPNVHHANHYDLVHIIRQVGEGLKRDGMAFTGESFKQFYGANMSTYTGAGGRYRFNFADGSALRSTVVKTVKDGAFTKIADLG